MGVVNGVKKAAARPGRLQMAMMMLMVRTEHRRRLLSWY